jgi:hypothetical protein
MGEVRTIRVAKDVEEILKRLGDDSTIDHLMVVAFFKGDDGQNHCRYEYSRGPSRFRMAGAMMWAMQKILADEVGP